MKLPYKILGESQMHPPIVFLHGLFGSGRNLATIARLLAEDRRVFLPDLRNHGAAPWDARHDYESMVLDLEESFGAMGTLDVMGHSMGGKAAMLWALRHSDRVRNLIVADIAPVPYEHGSSHLALIQAMRALDLGAIKTRADADLALAFAIPNPATRSFLVHGLVFDSGVTRFQNNLEVLEKSISHIMGFPEMTTSFLGRTLFINGELSDYIQDSMHAQIYALFPQAQFSTIKNTNHWLHAEKPQEFVSAIKNFLNEVA